MGQTIGELFDDFDPIPIGVASLAQVHVGHHKTSGRKVAVKVCADNLCWFEVLTLVEGSTSSPGWILQHWHQYGPVYFGYECSFFRAQLHLQFAIGWIKYWFPEFEFTWLGEEMRENLPREMDFVHEARNTARVVADFENIKTSLYIPEVISANKRVLIMEYIQGGRVDDLAYLSQHNIDRNKVALELTRIFNRMVFMNGWFHAVRCFTNSWARSDSGFLQDPHPGKWISFYVFSFTDVVQVTCWYGLLLNHPTRPITLRSHFWTMDCTLTLNENFVSTTAGCGYPSLLARRRLSTLTVGSMQH